MVGNNVDTSPSSCPDASGIESSESGLSNKCNGDAMTVHGANNFALLWKNLAISTPNDPVPQIPIDVNASDVQVIYFVRHGESLVNQMHAHGQNSAYLIEDPLLTAAGELQARSLGENPNFAPPPQLVVTSPMRRTIQTAVLGFGTGLPYVLRPDIQELGKCPCDRCNPQLCDELFQANEDWDAVGRAYADLPPGWHIKGPGWDARSHDRFAEFVKWLSHRPEKSIAVCGHSLFFKNNLGLSLSNCEVATFALRSGRLTNLDMKNNSASGSSRLLAVNIFSRVRSFSSPRFSRRESQSLSRQALSKSDTEALEIAGTLKGFIE